MLFWSIIIDLRSSYASKLLFSFSKNQKNLKNVNFLELISYEYGIV